MIPTIDDVLNLLASRGHSQYGGEPVTQLEHALQTATLAELERSSAEMTTSALLHDIGHLLHALPSDAPDKGIDDHHETSGYKYIKDLFPDAVTEPMRLHVSAKRYLCAVDDQYREQLSGPSIVSLQLQGGIMSTDETDQFIQMPFAKDAIKLRHWDEAAKDPEFLTSPLAHFRKYLSRVVIKND